MDKRVSELVAAAGAAAADLIMIIQGGANKKLTIQNLFAAINTPLTFNATNQDIDAVFEGMTDLDLIHVDASTDSVGVGTSTPAQKLDINGSLGTNGIVVHKSSNIQSAAGAISLTSRATLLDTTGAYSATLANGTAGQTKVLYARNTGTITVTATTPAGWTQIVFNAIGQNATLEFQDGKWFVVGSRGCSIT
jgi:hypothetical protein